MQAILLLRSFRHALMMSSVHSFNHIVLICMDSRCQLWFNFMKNSLIKLSTNYNRVLRRFLCISISYSVSNMFVLEVFLPLLNFCVNLYIRLTSPRHLPTLGHLPPDISSPNNCPPPPQHLPS